MPHLEASASQYPSEATGYLNNYNRCSYTNPLSKPVIK